MSVPAGSKQIGETLGTCVCTGVLTMSKTGSMASSVGLTPSVCALGHTLYTSVHTGLCLLPRACILQENAFWFLLLLVSGDLGRFQPLTFQIVRGLSLVVDKGGGCGMGPLKPLWILTNSLQKGTFDFRLFPLQCSSMEGN